MTDDEAVAAYRQAYDAAQRAADDFSFMLEKIVAVAANFRQWKGKDFAPDALRRCLDAVITERRPRGGRDSLNAEWPKGDDIHNALGDWKARRKSAGLAWISVPEHRRSAMKHPDNLDF